MSNWKRGNLVRVEVKHVADRPLFRETTPAEKKEWYDSPDARGMTDDGEIKLPPKTKSRNPEPGELFVIVRARVVAERGYHKVPSCALVQDVTGENWWVQRELLF